MRRIMHLHWLSHASPSSAAPALLQYYNTLEGFRDPAAEAGRRLRRLAAAAVPADAMAAGTAEAALEGGEHRCHTGHKHKHA
jgi:hypothetical protein